MICPNCGNTQEIKTERRPDGDSECGFCGHKGKTSAFQRPQAQRDRMQKAAEEQAKMQFHALRGFNAGESEWKDLQYGNELRAYVSSFSAGYTQAAKDAQAALDIAREALKSLLDHVGISWCSFCDDHSVHCQHGKAIEALAAIEKELGE